VLAGEEAQELMMDWSDGKLGCEREGRVLVWIPSRIRSDCAWEPGIGIRLLHPLEFDFKRPHNLQELGAET